MHKKNTFYRIIKLKILIIFLILISINITFAINNNDIEKVSCDYSFDSECNVCSQISNVKITDKLENIIFSHNIFENQFYYKEEQEHPYFVINNKKQVIKNSFEYTSAFNNTFSDEEEWYEFKIWVDLDLLEQNKEILINNHFTQEDFKNKTLWFLNYEFFTHKIFNNGEIKINPIKKMQCIKLIPYKDIKKLNKVDRKIEEFIYKNRFKNYDEKIQIYTNFIDKINLIISIKKYKKYKLILEYIRDKVEYEKRIISLSKMEIKWINDNRISFSKISWEDILEFNALKYEDFKLGKVKISWKTTWYVNKINFHFSNKNSLFPDDSYTLQNFDPWNDSKFKYYANSKFKVLDFGLNIYKITAYTDNWNSIYLLRVLVSEYDDEVIK